MIRTLAIASFTTKTLGTSGTSYHSQVYGTGIDAEILLPGITNGCCNNVNYMYINNAIQTYLSFELSFDLKVDSGYGGDYVAIFFGSGNVASNTNMNNVINTNGYYISFKLYAGDVGGRGLRIHNAANTILAECALPTISSTFKKVQIRYQRSVINTWRIYYDNVNHLTFNDPNNAAWVASTGTYWGFVSRTGGATFKGYIKSINLRSSVSIGMFSHKYYN